MSLKPAMTFAGCLLQKAAEARLLKSEQGKAFLLPRPALAPRHPSELLSVLPHDRGCPFEPDADAAPLVDISALGGNAPDNILRGQYRCHQSPP
jgi:hypothetical protein